MSVFSSLRAQDHQIYSSDSLKSRCYFDTTQVQKLLVKAHTFLGAKHCMGGSSPKCTDCSGLVWASFKHLALDLPRSANAQAFYGLSVDSLMNLKPGDLLFFQGTYSSRNYITHVGIYVKEGYFLHASSSKGVILTNLLESRYWKPKFAFAKRLFGQL